MSTPSSKRESVESVAVDGSRRRWLLIVLTLLLATGLGDKGLAADFESFLLDTSIWGQKAPDGGGGVFWESSYYGANTHTGIDYQVGANEQHVDVLGNAFGYVNASVTNCTNTAASVPCKLRVGYLLENEPICTRTCSICTPTAVLASWVAASSWLDGSAWEEKVDPAREMRPRTVVRIFTWRSRTRRPLRPG